MSSHCISALFALGVSAVIAFAQPAPASFSLVGDWTVQVAGPGIPGGTVHVQPPELIHVQAEPYSAIPLFQSNTGGWLKGVRLHGVQTSETTSPNLIEPESFVLRTGPEPDAPLLTRGADYDADLVWGTFGRLAGSRIQPDQTVFASYRYALERQDSIFLRSGKHLVLLQGKPHAATPIAPQGNPEDRLLGTIYVPGPVAKLNADNLFPLLEAFYPDQDIKPEPKMDRLVQRLQRGDSLRILAWGDSVTDGLYLADRDKQRWQVQFVARLRARFPKARIELLTQAWGGRNTADYLAEPPGSPHNFRETVLGMKPQLVISEFVNDSVLKPDEVTDRYGKLLSDFQAIGAEWIILTPHYVRPDWMGLTREREVDEDPRPYVLGLRRFAAKHDVVLADASLRWGRLWRQAIPYTTLLVNAINHPNEQGMRIFADTLMELFGQRFTLQ